MCTHVEVRGQFAGVGSLMAYKEFHNSPLCVLGPGTESSSPEACIHAFLLFL